MRKTGCYFFVFLPTFGAFFPIFITVSCHSEASLCKKNGRGRVPFPKTGPAPISERNAANSRGRTKPACGGRNLIFSYSSVGSNMLPQRLPVERNSTPSSEVASFISGLGEEHNIESNSTSITSTAGCI